MVNRSVAINIAIRGIANDIFFKKITYLTASNNPHRNFPFIPLRAV